MVWRNAGYSDGTNQKMEICDCNMVECWSGSCRIERYFGLTFSKIFFGGIIYYKFNLKEIKERM